MLILVLLANYNGNFRIISKGYITHQYSFILNIVALSMSAEIIIHSMQKRYIIRLVPVVDLPANIQILIPRKRCLIIPVVWN